MKFTEFDLDEKLLKGIGEAGFKECLPVQEKSLPPALQGKDITVKSQTGSGKTAAFMIPVLQYYCNAREGKRVKTLVVAPTRELAVQIESDARILGSKMDVSIASFYGGVGYKKQEDAILTGIDIIIGTPGRLLDFGKSGKINFKEIGKVVIDEADRLFDMGFYPDIKSMMKMLPPREERQTMLFSATLSSRVQNLAWDFMNLPESIEIESETVTVDEISQELYHTSSEEKFSLLLGLLKKYDPNNAIIFTNTKYAAVKVAERLKLNGYHVLFIMGDLPQKKRLSVIKKIKSGEVKFLVATDVAARGLHVDDLDLVVNYDIPEDFENYVHRIGRSARAGKSGRAITLACEKYVYGLEAIEKYIGSKIPVEWASAEMYAEDKSKGVRIDAGRYSQRDSRNGFRDRMPSRSSGSARGRSGSSGRSFGRGRSGSTEKFSGREAGRTKPPRTRDKQGARGGRFPEKAHSSVKSSPVEAVRRPKGKAAEGVKPEGRSHSKSALPKLSSKSTEAERLAYYRAKYGEDFKLVEKSDSSAKGHTVKDKGDVKGPERRSDSAKKKKQKGILKKLFGRKKK